MEWLPNASADVLIDAVPPLNGALPSDVAPSKNWTVPVAVAGVTVAVTVTLCPTTDGFGDVATAVELPAAFTVWTCAPEVLPVKLASPE